MTESGFGELLRRYRVASGLTQEELAERAGLSTRGISDLERGARGLPRKDTLQLLLQGLTLSQEDRAALIAAARRPPGAAPSRDGRELHEALPVSLTPLIGRETEITGVSDLLHEPAVRLLTLTGPGGTGKTRLALAVAEQVTPDFPDDVVFVPLAPLGDPAFVASAIAQRLSVREAVGQPLIERLKTALGDKRLLLVLDNFEHLLPAAPLVADLLAAAPSLKILTTSRAALHLSGEHLFPVPPLNLPDPGRLPSLDALAQNEAVRLFVDRARALKPGFALTNENAPAVVEIVRRLDGLPLALELAAARVRTLSPAALLARLDRRLPLLTGGAQDLPDRQRTLRDTIAWSYDLLPQQEQALFRRLAVFAGGFTLEAAETVADAGGEFAIGMVDGIASLADKSLLRQESGPDEEPRYLMLETVREYGLAQLEATSEEQPTRARHVTHFLTLTAEARPHFDGAARTFWMDRLEFEHDNLRAALTWLLEQEEAETALHLSSNLWLYWFARGLLSEGRRWLERVLALDGGVSRIPEDATLLGVEATYGAGALAYHQGDYQRATTLGMELLASSQECKNAAGLARSHYLLGSVAHDRGDAAQATAHFENSLAFARDLGNQSWSALALHRLGTLAYEQAEPDRAALLFTEALELWHGLDNPWGIAVARFKLGNVARSLQDCNRAVRLMRDSLTMRWEQRDKWGITESLSGLAAVAGMNGQAEQAARLFGAAEALREAIGTTISWDVAVDYEQNLASVRRTLDEETFVAAWAAGRALPLEEAVAEASSFAIMPEGRTNPDPVHGIATCHGLTTRQQQILRLIADGRSDREIAEALFLSRRTVTTHVTGILNKLGVPSRTAAVAVGIRDGII